MAKGIEQIVKQETWHNMRAIVVRLLFAVTIVLLPLWFLSCSSEKDDAKQLTPDQIQGNLIRQLIMMADQKQKTSEELDSVVDDKGWRSPEGVEAARRSFQTDSANMAQLEKIVDQHGWPGKSLVGDQAAMAAFLVLQYADLSLQEKYLPLVQAAADKGDVERSHLAMLQDRINMRKNKPQLYGTQLWNDPSTGKFGLYPIEDSVGVDARRAEVGLEPLADYLRSIGINPDSLSQKPTQNLEVRVKPGGNSK
jgi:hypothetical protein